MKAEFLKIAGVKSEAEFYKKFPSEEAFMKKHGKDVKKLMVKNAQIGAMIPNIETPTENLKPVSIDEEFLYDAAANRTGRKSMQEEKEDAMYQAQMESLKPKKKKPGLLEQLTGLTQGLSSVLGEQADLISGGGIGGGQNSGGTVTNFEAGPLEELGAGFKIGGKIKKAQGGGTATPQFNFDTGPAGPTQQGYYNADGSVNKGATALGQASDFLQSDAVQKWGLPIVSDIAEISEQLKAQKEQLAQAKQSRMVSEIALDAAKSEPEKIERDYVRPEDIQNTGEEFFPIYGVGTNVLARNGGMFSDPGYMPLENVNQVKSFARGGVLGSNSYLVPRAQGGFDVSNISYGGGGLGSAGQQFGAMLGINQDAGANIGGKIGGTIGSAFGPIGSAVGGFIGSGIGDLLDRDDRRTRIENERAERATKNLAFAAVAPQIQAGYASHVKDGGIIESMRSGGHMRGSYMPPNPSALDTMAMGGEVKTTWGGKVETVSYNPYAGGESIEFKGNSHDYLDPRTGQTGIGVAYGKNSVANNEAVVEVENEPAQQLRDGGGTENLVVYGDLKIPDEYLSEINDDRAKNMKFKNYVSNILNKDEAKVNKKMENAADKGLESDNTIWGQLERSTADAIVNGGDMKLQAIAEKKNILADLQNALNETFDEYGVKGNEFIAKNKIVEDPERMEMAKYGKKVPKAQGEGQQSTPPNNVSVEYFNKQIGGGDIPTTDKTVEELLEDKYVLDKSRGEGVYVKQIGDKVVAVKPSGKSLGYTPKGQSIDEGTGLAGGITMEQISELEKKNPWFGKFDFSKPKVKWKGKMVHPDVLRFQQDYNRRIEGTDIKPITQLDGVIGQETFEASYIPGAEGKSPKEEVVKVKGETTTETTTTAVPKQAQVPFIGGVAPLRGEALDINQITPELYAAATNQVQPVYAQTYQPALRVPYDISLQAAKNDVISQSRALQRNPALQNNPAALALAQAPTYEALNKINEAEFIANQKMKDEVYSGNIDALNKARLMNLGIYDQQQDRLAEATAKTRTQNIDILKSISDKYAQKKLENRLEQVFSNLYPTYRYDRNFRTQVQQPGMVNIPGYGTVSGIPSLATPGFNPALQQIPGVLGGIQSILGAQQEFNQQRGPQIRRGAIKSAMNDLNLDDIYDYVDPNQPYQDEILPIETGVAKKGKTVKKNYKNSNILRELRNR
jgi:hypothetical protein